MENIVTAQESKTQNLKWVTIQDPILIKLILESLGDEDMKDILNTVLDKPRTFTEILEITHLPLSSGYRKIRTLFDNGLLIDQGFTAKYDGKKMPNYRSIFENAIINIEKNKVVVNMLLTKDWKPISLGPIQV